MAAGVVGRGRRTRRRACAGAAGARRASRRPRGRPVAHAARMDPPRLGGDVDRRGRRRALSHELGEGVRIHPRTLRGSPRLRGGRGADTEARLDSRRPPRPPRDHPVRLAREARGGRTTRPASAARARRRGRPRDADLHLGHDRAAEGLHAHAPQPRHRGHPRGGGHAPDRRRRPPLPADGPQLRPARAPGGEPPRSDGGSRRRRGAGAGGAGRRTADGPAGRPACVREGACEHARRDRACRRPAQADRAVGARGRRAHESRAARRLSRRSPAGAPGANRRPARVRKGA